MIKVNYDTQTTLVKGYYPDFIQYNSIPEPYIEITEEQHQEALGKQMCVIDEVFQEYITPDSILLEQIKQDKIFQCQSYLNQTDWYIIRMSDPSNTTVVPENILINRANARSWQENIKNCETLEELNNININFN